MSSPGPPPTSVPKVVGPEKEDVSMREGTSSSSSDDEESSSDESTRDEQNGGESKENEATNDGSNPSNDTPSDAKDDTKTPSSDQGMYPISHAFTNIDSSSADSTDASSNSETSDNEVNEFVEKVNDYAILLYKNARTQGHEAKVRKYTRKLKRLARNFRKRDGLAG
jgi:hypothetical protein